jgi:hypothetical protein
MTQSPLLPPLLTTEAVATAAVAALRWLLLLLLLLLRLPTEVALRFAVVAAAQASPATSLKWQKRQRRLARNLPGKLRSEREKKPPQLRRLWPWGEGEGGVQVFRTKVLKQHRVATPVEQRAAAAAAASSAMTRKAPLVAAA